MTCAETKTWIHAYVDGELDLAKSLEIESHMEGCSECKSLLGSLTVLREGLREPSLSYASPQALEARLLSSIGATDETDTLQSVRPNTITPRLSPLASLRWFAAGAAACAVVALALWQTPSFRPAPVSLASITTQEILDSHLRSLEAGHLEDVISTNQHTVKPWFNGKISFSPPVNNLADQGYPLVGGRLDYLGSQQAAVLVYRYAKHIINVYVTMPQPQSPASDLTTTTSHGYHIDTWQDRDMTFTAVSDVNEQGLSRFVELFRAADR